tara:strand:- start:234 stop:482 length:249 start_codon:yes stop_codon:yes gene_type:complete
MPKVKDYLHQVKANKNTYHNLDDKTKQDFKNLYNYLKTHQEKEVSEWFVFYVNVNDWLNQDYILDYVIKYKAMEILSSEIKH